MGDLVLVPHPLTASAARTTHRATPSTGQRRRRSPGKPRNRSAAKATPEIAPGKVPPLEGPRPSTAEELRPFPTVVQAVFEVLTVTEPPVAVPLELTLGFTYVKHALVSDAGAETLSETVPLNPAGMLVIETVEVPLAPWVTVTLVAEMAKGEGAETVRVRVPEEASLTAELDGV